MVNLDKVIPYARNSRVHSDEQVAQIASSIQEWGFTVPILMDEGFGLIAGHGRLMAAQRLGLKEIPAMVAKNWTEAKKKAYIIADNKLAMNSTWDEAMLKIEIKELTDLNFVLITFVSAPSLFEKRAIFNYLSQPQLSLNSS